MKVKYAILGAGISGLTFANHLKTDDYMILEKESEAGGLCRTHHISLGKADFTWDYAGHFFHFKDEQTRKFFEPALSNEQCISQIKKTQIYTKGRFIDYPFQKNIHQLDKEDMIDCLYHLFFRKEQPSYNSFKNMLMGKFGKGICDRFLIPYNEKLYACDLNTLDQDAMGRFFPYADLADIIRNMKEQSSASYNDRFIYPINGAQTVINFLLGKVDPEKLRLNEEVREIDIKGKKIVTSGGGEIYEYQYLISSIPFHQLMDRMGIDVEDKLSWNRVLVFNIGFDKPAIDNSLHWVYYPDPDINFYRVGFYNNILRQEPLSLYVEIGFNHKENVDIERQYALTLTNLKKCGIIDDHQVLAHESLLIDPAYVHISARSKAFVQEMEQTLMQNGVYLAGRYGEWTYCSMEDCFMRAKELAEQIS